MNAKELIEILDRFPSSQTISLLIDGLKKTGDISEAADLLDIEQDKIWESSGEIETEVETGKSYT